MAKEDFGINIGSIQSNQTNVGQYVTAIQNNSKSLGNSYSHEVFHILGDKGFGISDSKALEDAGVETLALDATVQPYFKLFVDELARQRADNKIKKFIHFSGHGGSTEGILFGEEWIDWDKFNAVLTAYDDLEILFIAACSTIKVADAVSGKFKYVLACATDVPDKDAILATQVFWRNINNGKSAEEAFENVKRNVPDFAPNLRLRGL